MIVLYLLLIGACLTILISLAVFMWIAGARDNSATLFALICNSKYLDIIHKVFLASVLIGFLICFHNGAYALLFWLPDDWGSYNEGEFQSYRFGISASFAGVFGLIFLNFIVTSIRDKFDLQELKLLSKIKDSSGSEHSLNQLKSEFCEQLDSLRAPNSRHGNRRRNSIDVFKDEQRRLYTSLINKTDNLIQNLKEKAEIQSFSELTTDDNNFEWASKIASQTVFAVYKLKRLEKPGHRLQIAFARPGTSLVLQSSAPITASMHQTSVPAKDSDWITHDFFIDEHGPKDNAEIRSLFIKLWDKAGTTYYDKDEWRTIRDALMNSGYRL